MERSKWGRGFKRKRNQPHTLKGGMCWLSLYSFTIAQKLPLTTPDHKWQLHFTTPSPSKVHFDPGNAQNRGNGGLSFAVSCICFTTKHFYRETWRLKFPLVNWHEIVKRWLQILEIMRDPRLLPLSVASKRFRICRRSWTKVNRGLKSMYVKPRYRLLITLYKR